MRSHDRLRIVLTQARQFWRAFAYVMHLHENRYIKRAGVAGIRARASDESGIMGINFKPQQSSFCLPSTYSLKVENL
ncbi:hypothetical protein C3O72_02045 [Cronobacter sakazakii]|nr:hypothetical protein [Cronobacter sakazakii]EGT4470610.1 hypothetical protein [Cronobacter sakazakii]RRA38109.1 hypothetical protein C3O72_02045 [Cronobacter sakazakii]